MCFSPQRRAIFRHLHFKKCVRDRQFFKIFTCKCTFRHSGVQFLDIWTSKSGPKHEVFCTFWLTNVRFATAACNFWTSELQKVLREREVFCTVFDLQMCVSPQRRAIFGHLNFKKCSETVSFLSFSLTNVRFATAACNFWTSGLQKVLRTWGVLYILT